MGFPLTIRFGGFFRALDPENFQSIFRDWIKTFQTNIDTSVIAIDGKCSRHTFDTETKMLHMVSAFATETRLVLAQQKVDEKSNEIKAIPQVLKWLDLKGNQETLHTDTQTLLSDSKVLENAQIIEDHNKSHGRIESRTCFVTHDVASLHKRHPHRNSIKSLIRIDSTRNLKGKITQESRYYIASDQESPTKALKKIRSHWMIENSLHWILDMSFGEDQSRIRKKNAPHCMAIIRHIAQNLLQLQKKTNAPPVCKAASQNGRLG